MTELVMYAIRHVITGNYLLGTYRYGGEGISHREPRPYKEIGPVFLPRLYPTPSSARRSLTQWLRGHFDQDDSGVHIRAPKHPRLAEEMEIVAVTLNMELTP